jgi:hypothetical protein
MMKRILVFAGVAVIAILSFSSCRKCVTCKAIERSTGVTVDETEYCGMKKVVDTNEDTYKAIWGDSYYSATCN